MTPLTRNCVKAALWVLAAYGVLYVVWLSQTRT